MFHKNLCQIINIENTNIYLETIALQYHVYSSIIMLQSLC